MIIGKDELLAEYVAQVRFVKRKSLLRRLRDAANGRVIRVIQVIRVIPCVGGSEVADQVGVERGVSCDRTLDHLHDRTIGATVRSYDQASTITRPTNRS